MQCPSCRTEQSTSADECASCGIIYSKWRPREDAPSVLTAGVAHIPPPLPISRLSLNLMAFIGLFIFGWLIAVVFDKLGRRGLGWAYLVPVLAMGSLSRQVDVGFAFGAFLIYVVAWFHANMILSSLEATRR